MAQNRSSAALALALAELRFNQIRDILLVAEKSLSGTSEAADRVVALLGLLAALHTETETVRAYLLETGA